MAVLLKRSRIFSVDSFLSRMKRAADAIVLVNALMESGPRQICTGWFVTPELVMIPGFVVEQAKSSLSVEIGINGGFEAKMYEIIGSPELLGASLMHEKTTIGIALLRVPVPQPQLVLPLSFDIQSQGDAVTVLQYPSTREPSASFGEILSMEEQLIRYDADTLPGSSGGPVLDHHWRVVGIHAGVEGSRQANYGINRQALLDALTESNHWRHIASVHRIADDRHARDSLRVEIEPPQALKPDPVLINAALMPTIDRSSLADNHISKLAGLVVDPKAEKWTLRVPERRRIIADVGSLDELRKHLKPSEGPDAPERIVRNILSGPPYDFENDDEASLSWWIQIVRWFSGLVSDLPSPAAVSRVLERRRVRSRLNKITDGDFRGRTAQLDRLRKWYEKGDGPVVVNGVGGIGKSSIVARFASELPEQTLLLWLDFDRADLAPDDATSVLSVLTEQAAIQLENFVTPPTTGDDWIRQAESLGESIQASMGSPLPPLIVLDSFEAAQYSTRYQEIWPLLEAVCNRVPLLRVCVTGRAPVPDLKLRGKPASSIKLEGIEPADAREWLREKGIAAPHVLDKCVELARGIPLIIRLALRFVELGGRVEDLPRDLPPAIVAGYLYDRILDRVQNADFKPLASALLVVRRITEDMLSPMFSDLVEMPPGTPAEWFAELSREMALVEGGIALRPRPEVRAATLTLLEQEKPELVNAIDQRAVKWYEFAPSAALENTAELIYHRLRLNDVHGAERAWRDGVGAFLTFAADDLRHPQARTWLLQRLGAAPETGDLLLWEQEASERIRSSRKRSLDRSAKQIALERTARSENSPLLFHDSYELLKEGNGRAAEDLLSQAGDAPGTVGRDRLALRALLAREAGDLRTADRLLAQIEDDSLWTREDDAQLMKLSLRAARIRLSVDLEAEAEFIESARGAPKAIVGYDEAAVGYNEVIIGYDFMSPADVLMPRLKQRLQGGDLALESASTAVDVAKEPASVLLERIQQKHALLYPGTAANGDTSPDTAFAGSLSFDGLWDQDDDQSGDITINIGKRLVLASRRRWLLAASTNFLADSCGQFVEKTGAIFSPLGQAVLGTLSLFGSRFPTFSVLYSGFPVSQIILSSDNALPSRMSREAWQRTLRFLRVGIDPAFDWQECAKVEGEAIDVSTKSLLSYRARDRSVPMEDVFLFMRFLVSPDPLNALIASLAGSGSR